MKSKQFLSLLLVSILMGCFPVSLAAGELQPAGRSDVAFSFYGQVLSAPGVDGVKVKSVRDQDVAMAWHEYQRRNVEPVLSSLRTLSVGLGLNDWFVFRLVRDYVDGLLGDDTPADRVLLQHFLLVQLGYDVRLARTDTQLLLLVPLEQEVYEHGFIRIGSKEYYLFFDALEANMDERSTIYPCDPLGKDAGKGRTFSLLFTARPLNVSSGNIRVGDFDDGTIHVACSIDDMVIRMLRDYPLMDLQCYTSAVVLPQFHDELLGQLTPQLADMSQCDAAQALLHFVQHVFGYEEDIDQYGQEKINFVEENFYYENNDCEDRSILYAFLVNSLLGLDVQLVHYPGHECTAVRFTQCDVRGNGYYYGKDYYLICDPSYMDGAIGRCMPRYRAMQPAVRTTGTSLLSDNSETPLQPRLDKRIFFPDISIDVAPTDTVALQ